MQVNKEMVESWITDGSASAMQAAKGEADKIAAQINAELATNKSSTSSNTIKMSISIKLDADSRKVEIEGSYGFAVPNLGNAAPKLVREIPDPDQGELEFEESQPPVFDNTQAESPVSDEDEDAEGMPE